MFSSRNYYEHINVIFAIHEHCLFLAKQYLLFFLKKQVEKANLADTKEFGYNTLDDIWRVICWMLTICYCGVYPSVDWNNDPWPLGSDQAKKAGRPLFAGYFFVLWMLAGDYEWHANSIGLAHWAAAQMCSFCPANYLGAPFNEFTPWSSWVNRIFDREHILHNLLPHRIFNFPGVVCNLYFVQLDVLHIVFLGVALHVLGNSIFSLANDSGIPGGYRQRL